MVIIPHKEVEYMFPVKEKPTVFDDKMKQIDNVIVCYTTDSGMECQMVLSNFINNDKNTIDIKTQYDKMVKEITLKLECMNYEINMID